MAVYEEKREYTEELKDKLFCSVYGVIRLPYTNVFHRVRRMRWLYIHFSQIAEASEYQFNEQ
jgi:hypothetical protein